MRQTIFGGLLTLFMLSFFFVAEMHQRNWLLYLTALSAHAFLFDAAAWRRAMADGRGIAVLLLVGFPLLSLLWSDGMDRRDVRAVFVAGYCILAIYFGSVQLVHTRAQDVERLKHLLLAAAVITSLLSVGSWVITDHRGDWRLHGLLGLTNPVHASILLLATTLPAVRRIRLDRVGLCWLAACLLPWSFAFLAGARAALGIYLVVVALLLGSRLSIRSNVLVGAGVLVAASAALLVVDTDVLRNIWLARGISYRDVIWSQVWSQFLECNPLIGCGMGTPLSIVFAGVDSTRPHSLFLGALYYQGFVGTLVFLGGLGYLVIRALRTLDTGIIDRHDWIAMLGYGLLANLTSGDHIMVRATLFWSYFWLPLLVIAALRGTAGAGAVASGTENSR